MMDKSISIRRVKAGDENSLAYVQTESWKEAFREIVPADILSQCTEIERAAEMYKMLLAENKGNESAASRFIGNDFSEVMRDLNEIKAQKIVGDFRFART